MPPSHGRCSYLSLGRVPIATFISTMYLYANAKHPNQWKNVRFKSCHGDAHRTADQSRNVSYAWVGDMPFHQICQRGTGGKVVVRWNWRVVTAFIHVRIRVLYLLSHHANIISGLKVARAWTRLYTQISAQI